MLLADHGHIQVDEADVVPLAAIDGLENRLVSAAYGHGPVGEFPRARRRGSGSEIRPGARDGRFGPHCRDRTRACRRPLGRRDRVRPGLSGRIGDVLALMRGSATLFHAYRV